MDGDELRKLDVEIHQKVMGKRCEFIKSEPATFEVDPSSFFGMTCNFGGAVFTDDREWLCDEWLDLETNRELPHYSTDIAAAWEAMEAIAARDMTSKLYMCQRPRRWLCSIMHGGVSVPPTEGETPMLAICRAALKAVAIPATPGA